MLKKKLIGCTLAIIIGVLSISGVMCNQPSYKSYKYTKENFVYAKAGGFTNRLVAYIHIFHPEYSDLKYGIWDGKTLYSQPSRYYDKGEPMLCDEDKIPVEWIVEYIEKTGDIGLTSRFYMSNDNNQGGVGYANELEYDLWVDASNGKNYRSNITKALMKYHTTDGFTAKSLKLYNVPDSKTVNPIIYKYTPEIIAAAQAAQTSQATSSTATATTKQPTTVAEALAMAAKSEGNFKVYYETLAKQLSAQATQTSQTAAPANTQPTTKAEALAMAAKSEGDFKTYYEALAKKLP